MARRQKSRTQEDPIRKALGMQMEEWQALTPAERLRRSWTLRRLIPDPQAVHDAKLFPRP